MTGLTPGDEVGSYVIQQELGSGGMATVYLARHAVLESRHAIKILHSELVGDERIRDRFLAEGRIQAQVPHPNIVRVTDILATPGVAALVMEHVEGPTLRELLDSEMRPMTAGEIGDHLLPLLRAVEAVHTRGVIHRDLKPSNIIVARHPDGSPRPVLLDFGVARLIKGADVLHSPKGRTRTGAQLGTAGYMSPEQIRGEADVDARTDIFALGAILYELATARRAFDSDSEFDTMRKVMDGRYTPADQTTGAVPPALSACIRSALAGDRDARFADCGTFATALAAALAEPPAGPSPSEQSKVEPTSHLPLKSNPFRRWALGGVLLAAFLAAIAVVVAVIIALDRHEAEARADNARADSARAMEMLHKRQTDPALNKDPMWLSNALGIARRGEQTARTSESLAAVAILTVLNEGWHLQSKEWDSDEYAATDRLVSRALARSPAQVEAFLARGILAARGCRLMDPESGARGEACASAESAFEAADLALTADDRWWLRFELSWIRVDYLNDRAREAQLDGGREQAGRIASPGLALCESAGRDLGRGSVNDSVLRGSCMTAAGLAGNYSSFVEWGRRIRRHDERGDGAMGSRTVRFMYQRAGPPECLDLEFGRHRAWDRTYPITRSVEAAFCTAVGLFALDCPSQGQAAARRGSQQAPTAFEWAAPRAAWSATDGLECYLTADVAGP